MELFKVGNFYCIKLMCRWGCLFLRKTCLTTSKKQFIDHLVLTVLLENENYNCFT